MNPVAAALIALYLVCLALSPFWIYALGLALYREVKRQKLSAFHRWFLAVPAVLNLLCVGSILLLRWI